MTDLVKALRSRATWETATGITEPHEHIDWMAADEITRLREENARLLGLLREAHVKMDANNLWSNLRNRVVAAIREGGKDA